MYSIIPTVVAQQQMGASPCKRYGCGFDPNSGKLIIFVLSLSYEKSTVLCSATQHTTPQKFGGK